MGIFINLSNHPSSMWQEAQLAAALKYGKVVDMPFPLVPAAADEEEVEQLACEYERKITTYEQPMVMLQGEFTLVYRLVTKLKARNITVVAACSERIVSEVVEDGKYIKKATFEFVRFRKY